MKVRFFHINIVSFLTLAASMMLLFPSCHFGSIDDVMPRYENTVREIQFTVSVTDGSNGSDLALFSPVLTDDQGQRSLAAHLTPTDRQEFGYETRHPAIFGNGDHADAIAFLPYSYARYAPADSTELMLDYSVQDGTFNTIQANATYAMSRFLLTCDSENIHGQAHGPSDGIVLSPLQATLRVNLISEDGTMSLADMLQQKAVAFGGGCSITDIQITNHGLHGPVADRVIVNMLDSTLHRIDQRTGTITLRQADGLNMIGKQTFEVQRTETISWGGTSWGTSFFVSLPAFDDTAGSLIKIIVRCSYAGRERHYYGIVRLDRPLVGGHRYCTTSVRCWSDPAMIPQTAYSDITDDKINDIIEDISDAPAGVTNIY
ncbi:MAG: hypothetical protein KBT20_08475 [Bacteroidales bacterium]|nr:hypothetical protein [Candidatus Liminaster caballi]